VRSKAIGARILFVEAAMNAPRSPTLPQWKIDLVREAMRVIKVEKGRRVTAAMIARRIPSFSMVDIEIAMRLLRAQQRSESEADR
jgi:hypothetical protein